MSKNSTSRNGFNHLYNREVEGLGSYDVHYINAYKKTIRIRSREVDNDKERSAA
tara:strand:- start:189 stop:350 length:162 start_codon:yes stop_codon:yes gene_type:complete